MEFATLENRVKDREAGVRPISHCDRNGAVELDHESSRDAKQYIVKCNDLRPVKTLRCGLAQRKPSSLPLLQAKAVLKFDVYPQPVLSQRLNVKLFCFGTLE